MSFLLQCVSSPDRSSGTGALLPGEAQYLTGMPMESAGGESPISRFFAFLQDRAGYFSDAVIYYMYAKGK